MVNEELSAKSLHFVVDYAVKPAAKEIIKSLEKICLQLKAQNQKQKEKGAKESVLGKLKKLKEKVASIPRKVVEKRKEQIR